MTAARQYDSVRTTVPAVSLFDGRTIPAGMVGAVLEVMPDGTCLVDLAFRPRLPTRTATSCKPWSLKASTRSSLRGPAKGFDDW